MEYQCQFIRNPASQPDPGATITAEMQPWLQQGWHLVSTSAPNNVTLLLFWSRH